MKLQLASLSVLLHTRALHTSGLLRIRSLLITALHVSTATRCCVLCYTADQRVAAVVMRMISSAVHCRDLKWPAITLCLLSLRRRHFGDAEVIYSFLKYELTNNNGRRKFLCHFRILYSTGSTSLRGLRMKPPGLLYLFPLIFFTTIPFVASGKRMHLAKECTS
jgi:hypothetical protein